MSGTNSGRTARQILAGLGVDIDILEWQAAGDSFESADLLRAANQEADGVAGAALDVAECWAAYRAVKAANNFIA